MWSLVFAGSARLELCAASAPASALIRSTQATRNLKVSRGRTSAVSGAVQVTEAVPSDLGRWIVQERTVALDVYRVSKSCRARHRNTSPGIGVEVAYAFTGGANLLLHCSNSLGVRR